MSSKPESREIVSGRVSAASAKGWKDFCQNNGISLAAFLEAAGLALSKESFPPSVKERQMLVERAREVDLERPRRR